MFIDVGAIIAFDFETDAAVYELMTNEDGELKTVGTLRRGDCEVLVALDPNIGPLPDGRTFRAAGIKAAQRWATAQLRMARETASGPSRNGEAEPLHRPRPPGTPRADHVEAGPTVYRDPRFGA